MIFIPFNSYKEFIIKIKAVIKFSQSKKIISRIRNTPIDLLFFTFYVLIDIRKEEKIYILRIMELFLPVKYFIYLLI